jgi:predicted DNA-binding transcriptional regulator AlpA
MVSRPVRLVGAHEIRELLGVTRQRVYQLARGDGFPSPVATLAQGKIWLIDDIEAWIGEHRPGTGRL